MSTLRVDSIQNRTGGDLLNSAGIAKAWVNFNGTGTVAIRASLNVSSITDNGTGDYTVNFTSALTDANYAASLYSDGATGAGQMQRISQTTSAFRVGTGDRTYTTSLDGVNNFVTVFR